jgi:hypothetical protein
VLDLQSGLAARFPSENVTVTLFPPSTLTVELRSHPASEEERRQLALRTAEFVRDNYVEYVRLQVVNVSSDSVASTGPFSVVSSKVVYRFARRNLGEPSRPLPSSQGAPDREPVITLSGIPIGPVKPAPIATQSSDVDWGSHVTRAAVSASFTLEE